MLKLKGIKVRELIGKSGMSVRSWGQDHGFAQSTLSSWLNGTRNIKKIALVKLAEALHVDNLSEISFAEFRLDQAKLKAIEAEKEEVCNLWGHLKDDQRKTVLDLIRSIAETNMNREGEK